MTKFITAREAAKLIADGSTVGVAGMGLSGWPEEVAQEIANNYLETGHPCNLTMKQGSAMGDWKERGMTRLGHEGLVTHWCGAHIGSAFAMNDLVRANKMHCHTLPQGIIVNLWREIAAGRPGLLSKIGLGTYVDPRIEGGKMNEITTEELVELVEFQGEEYLFYKSFPLDVALLRGTIADEKGNISFEKESVIHEGLAVAEAAHNSGGIVIVQVEYPAIAGSLHPKEVKIPGILVDYVVVATKQEASWQTEGVYYEPSFAGNLKRPLSTLPVTPLDARKIIGRRCAMELRKGNILNFGIGMPTEAASVLAEEGFSEAVTMTAEAGAIGGVPASSPNFGSSYNPEATIDHGAMFDFYDGGGLDAAILGLAQADKNGNINVSKFGSRLSGPGGFINITQSAKKVMFCGTFMVKSFTEVKDSMLKILEGEKGIKFLNQVEQITFSGDYASKFGQDILYITERAVFRLIDGELVLIEIAPGVDLEKDIFENMEFRPKTADKIELMLPAIFEEKWGGLGEYINR